MHKSLTFEQKSRSISGLPNVEVILSEFQPDNPCVTALGQNFCIVLTSLSIQVNVVGAFAMFFRGQFAAYCRMGSNVSSFRLRSAGCDLPAVLGAGRLGKYSRPPEPPAGPKALAKRFSRVVQDLSPDLMPRDSCNLRRSKRAQT